MKNYITLFFTFLSFGCLLAQSSSTPSPILFIYDASGSMWGQMEGRTKKDIAADVMAKTLGTLPDDQRTGLIVYGHRSKGDCNDIEFMVPLANSDKEKVNSKVKGLNPTGKTPLARSAQQAIESLKKNPSKATIILITDGIESCDGDLCKVVSDAREAGVDFKLHIVGFGLKDGEKEALQCAAGAGNGNYYDATNAKGLSSVLTEATRQTVDQPDGNFSIYAVKNNKAVDAMVKIRKVNDRADLGGFRTYRDTASYYVPAGRYVVEVRPLENTDVSATEFTVEVKDEQAIFRRVSFDSGKLRVRSFNNKEEWDSSAKVLFPDSGKQATAGRTYGRPLDFELNPGTYDLELRILTVRGLAIEKSFEGIEIKSGETTELTHTFESGKARIGVQTENGELIDATVVFHEKESGKNVAANRTYTSPSSNPKEFILNPGVYKVKINTLGAHKGNSKEITVEVSLGTTVERILKF